MLISLLFYPSSLITGNAFRPDLLLITKESVLYIFEHTIGFQTKVQINSERKASKYYPLQQALLPNYNQIKFILLSLEALGTIASSSESFIALLKWLGFGSKRHKHFI